MEQLFAGTAFMSHLTVELLEVLFYYPVLSWISRIHKCYERCLPLLLSLVGFFSLVFGIQEDDREEKALARSKVTAPRPTEEDIKLSREDVDAVIESLGIGCGGGDEQFKEIGSADDLNCLFEEKEPSLEEVNEAFCAFDLNGDGFIDPEDLQRVLSILGFKEVSAAGDCRRMIDAYDENGDGRIDFHEFVKLMECSFC